MLNDRSLPCWDRCPSEFSPRGTDRLADLDPKHSSLFIKLFIETELDSGSGKLEEKTCISYFKLKKCSSHLLDDLSDFLICAPKKFQVSSKGFEPFFFFSINQVLLISKKEETKLKLTNYKIAN